MPDERQPRTNLNNIATFAAIEAAAIAAILLSMVTSHVDFVKKSVFIPVARAARYRVDKSARGAYYALLTAANSEFAQRVLPAGSSLNQKIKTACTISRKLLGGVFAGITVFAYYFVASAYVIAVALLTIPVFNILHALRFVNALCACIVGALSEVLRTNTSKDHKECLTQTPLGDILLKSPAITTVFSLKCTLLFVPTISYRTFSSTCMTLLTPLYMLSSLFGLNNRFNIYNYRSGVGYVHCYIQDKQERVTFSTSQGLIEPIESDQLVKEATDHASTCRFPGGEAIYPYSSVISSTVTKHTQQSSEVLGR